VDSPPDNLPTPESAADDTPAWSSLAGWADVTPVPAGGPQVPAGPPPPGVAGPRPPWPPSPAHPAPPPVSGTWAYPAPPSAAPAPSGPRPAPPGPAWSATGGHHLANAPWQSAPGWAVPAAPAPATVPPGTQLPPGTPVLQAPPVLGVPSRRRPGRLVVVLATVAGVLLAAGVAGGLFAVATRSGGAGPAAAAAPSTTTATPSPAWTAAQRALEARLDPASVRDCRPNPAPAGAGITAALFCSTTDTGQRIAVFAYRDDASLQADVTARADAVTGDGRCETGGSEVFTWDTGPGSPAGGTVICDAREGQHFVFWSSDSDLVSFLGYGSDPRALFDWWESFAPFPGSAGGPSEAPRPA